VKGLRREYDHRFEKKLPADMAIFLLDTSVIIDVLKNKRNRPALLLDFD
jgi:hypothetical protein